MNATYLDTLTALITQEALQFDGELTFKNVFGAVGAYVNGHIFASCGQFGVALKLPPDTVARLLATGLGTPLRYFPKGHIKRGYAVLSEDLLNDHAAVLELIEESTRSLPQTTTAQTTTAQTTTAQTTTAQTTTAPES